MNSTMKNMKNIWKQPIEKTPLAYQLSKSFPPNPSLTQSISHILTSFSTGSTFSFICRYDFARCSIRTNGNSRGVLEVGDVEKVHDSWTWHEVEGGRKVKQECHDMLIKEFSGSSGSSLQVFKSWLAKVDSAGTTEEVKRVKKDIQEAYGLVRERKSIVRDSLEKWSEVKCPCNPAGLNLATMGSDLIKGTNLDGDEWRSALSEHPDVYEPLAMSLASREMSRNWAAAGFDEAAFYRDNTIIAVNYTPAKKGKNEPFNGLKMNMSQVAKFDDQKIARLKPTQVLKIKRTKANYDDAKKLEKERRQDAKTSIGTFTVRFKISDSQICEFGVKRVRSAVSLTFGDPNLNGVNKKVVSFRNKVLIEAAKGAFGMPMKGQPRVSKSLPELQAFVERVEENNKKKSSSRCQSAWADKTEGSLKRAGEVFCQNVKSGLGNEGVMWGAKGGDARDVVVGVDPGFRSGFKIAVLKGGKGDGWMDTIDIEGLNNGMGGFKWMEGDKVRRSVFELMVKIGQEANGGEVDFAIGTGTGGEDVREYLAEIAEAAGVHGRFNRVTEDGASVWSTSKDALEEFSHVERLQPEWLGAVSIGRRFVSPLAELLKVPPRSMGFGMYQHDVKEKDLSTGLQRTVEDVVAERGVWVNYETPSLLKYVPGLTKPVRERIIEGRPFSSRRDMKERVKGMGDKMFENAAGFCRISGGEEALDDSRVHSRDYDVARWMVRNGEASKRMSMRSEEIDEYRKGAEGGVDVEERARRCVSSLERRAGTRLTFEEEEGVELPQEFRRKGVKLEDLPLLKRLKGVVSNMTDFGVFVNFGMEGCDGLVHTSKLGPMKMKGLAVGGAIIVDIINVEAETKRISLRRSVGEEGEETKKRKVEG
ncbi:hypothetical protein TrRE_jg4142, partial [Triparma retinervis]